MTGDLQMDNELELVRRGFDPAQVQQLVGQLSTELKSMAAENERLRARVTELEHAPVVTGASTAPDDVFTHWSKETNDLLAAARSSIATVTEKATADAAAAIAAGETAGASIRQRAQLDAEGVVSEARHQAAGIVAEAEAAKAAIEAEAQGNVDLKNEQVAKLEAKLEELRGHRSTMSTQLATAKSQLLNLLAMVDGPEDQAQADASGLERASTEELIRHLIGGVECAGHGARLPAGRVREGDARVFDHVGCLEGHRSEFDQVKLLVDPAPIVNLEPVRPAH